MADKKIIRNLQGWLREGENINIFCDALIKELDLAKAKKEELKTQIRVSSATGIYLDDIAKIFNLSRRVGETDQELRSRIVAFWPGYSGSGTIEHLKAVINRITGIPEEDIDIDEIEFAKFLVNFNIGPNFNLIDLVKELVFANKASGVYPFFQIRTGFSDTVIATDLTTLTAIPDKLYGEFSWGDDTLW